MNHQTIARELRSLVDRQEPVFLAWPEAPTGQPPQAGKWSQKEILGHLIDSAVNNHQRIVRMQKAPLLEFPNYQQNDWVALNHYATRSWAELVALWAALNRHLAHVIHRLDPAALHHVWHDGSDRFDLAFVVEDYLVHLRHHLDQLMAGQR